MVIGSSKNLHVFNFVILLKSRKFDAREIYVFYSSTIKTTVENLGFLSKPPKIKTYLKIFTTIA